MTKLPSYDELEIDESPRVCGGAVFLKLMKKGKCGSSSQKDESQAVLTSSESSSSSQTSSTSINNIYDPSKTHFCMPRQVEGIGTMIATESKGCYKLDFKLQAEEHADFYFNNIVDRTDNFATKKTEVDDLCVEDRARFHSTIQFNPQVVNDLKKKHMQSINGERNSEGSSKIGQWKNERKIPEKSSASEQTMSLKNDPEKASKLEQSIKTPRNGFLMEEADDVNESEDVDGAWNTLQRMRLDQETNEGQGLYESKALVLRKEMTSFRRELNAVKKSLPNQFHTNHFTDKSETKEISKRETTLRGQELHAVERALPNQVTSKQYSDHGDSWNVTAFASNTLEEQTREHANCDQKYFKNDWNLNFQDQENDNKTEPGHSTPIKMHNNENLGYVLETNESFPECPEMPFDQGLNPEEIEINESTSPEEIESNEHSNTCDEGRECVALSSQSRPESAKVESHNSNDTAHNCNQQEKTEGNRASTKTNYEKDMEIVRTLLSKYGENIDEKLRVDKARRIHAIIDAPTDAWFHRHATGMFRKSGKSSTLKSDEASNLPQRNSRIYAQSLPERPKLHQGKAPQVSSRKINRVHFKNPAVDEATEKSTLKHWKSNDGNRASIEVRCQPNNRAIKSTGPAPPAQSPGRLSQKIKFWEGRNDEKASTSQFM